MESIQFVYQCTWKISAYFFPCSQSRLLLISFFLRIRFRIPGKRFWRRNQFGLFSTNFSRWRGRFHLWCIIYRCTSMVGLANNNSSNSLQGFISKMVPRLFPSIIFQTDTFELFLSFPQQRIHLKQKISNFTSTIDLQQQSFTHPSLSESINILTFLTLPLTHHKYICRYREGVRLYSLDTISRFIFSMDRLYDWKIKIIDNWE